MMHPVSPGLRADACTWHWLWSRWESARKWGLSNSPCFVSWESAVKRDPREEGDRLSGKWTRGGVSKTTGTGHLSLLEKLPLPFTPANVKFYSAYVEFLVNDFLSQRSRPGVPLHWWDILFGKVGDVSHLSSSSALPRISAHLNHAHTGVQEDGSLGLFGDLLIFVEVEIVGAIAKLG